MKYGIGYKGGKQRIADDILSLLPDGERFVDLFGGGFAMSHAAYLSGKFRKVLYCDNEPMIVQLIQDGIAGKYNPSVFIPAWVSRERFHELKKTDAYVKYCWSFANNGRSYIFSDEMAEKKKPVFEMLAAETVSERRRLWRAALQAISGTETSRMQMIQPLQNLERVTRLESLENLERVTCLEIRCADYREYQYEAGDVVYCDIPYENSTSNSMSQPDTYERGFSHKEFYEWAYTRPFQVWFSSYSEISDDRFYCVPVKPLANSGFQVHGPKVNKRMECLWSNFARE